jgi:uncharacterized membrane protein YgdD (TMEM256/DUF423 family)
MEKTFVILRSLSAGLAVALGAFGAHALRNRLSHENLAVFETGVRYEFYHALAMIAAAWVHTQRPASLLPDLSGWLFLAGTLLFSGSLYLLVLTDKRFLGAITPLGGLAFIAGWVCLALS